MVLIKYAHIISLTSMLVLAAAIMASCSSDMSNKTERNAIKAGNEKYKKELYVDAIKDYDKALKANPYSEAAKYDKAMATIMGATAADTSKLREARLALANLGKTASDPNISERAIYNLGNDAVFIGDYLKDLADSLRRADIQMGAPSAAAHPTNWLTLSRRCLPKAISKQYQTIKPYLDAIHPISRHCRTYA